MRIDFGDWRDFLEELSAVKQDGGRIVGNVVRYRIVYDPHNKDLPDATVALILSALVADKEGERALLEFAAHVGVDEAESPLWRDLITDFAKMDQKRALEITPLIDHEGELILDEVLGNHPVFLDSNLTGTAGALLIIREFHRFAALNSQWVTPDSYRPLFKMRSGKIELF